jgi:hypothetical protein
LCVKESGENNFARKNYSPHTQYSRKLNCTEKCE